MNVKDASLPDTILSEVFYREGNGPFDKIINNEIVLKRGRHELRISSPEYSTQILIINALGDTTILIYLVRKQNELEAVLINGSVINKLKDVQGGRERITNIDLYRIPSLLGEKDIVRSFQLLPGINSSSEGAADLNVRGGTADQNLVLLDGLNLYSTSHLLGLVSVFNPSVIQSADIYKSGFPARFGGKVSSVLDVTTFTPNRDSTFGSISLGIISSSAFANIPFHGNKSALIISGRRSILDLIKKITDPQGENYGFNDAYLKYNRKVNDHTQLNFTAYHDKDKTSFIQRDEHDKDRFNNSELRKEQSYLLGELKKYRGKHTHSYQLYYNRYRLNLSEKNHLSPPEYQEFLSENTVSDIGGKWISSYDINSGYNLNIGAQVISHSFKPAALTENQTGIITQSIKLPPLTALDISSFAEVIWKPTNSVHLRPGIRFNLYRVGSGSYLLWEPRLSSSLFISDELTIKASYNRLSQPIHTLVNNGLGLPIDLIVSSDKFIKPQLADQFSFGLTTYVGSRKPILITLETYYNKQFQNITYRDGFDSRSFTIGSTISTERWQDGVVSGKGKSYGAELLIEKRTGFMQGWLSYTLSSVRHSFSQLDNGKYFFPKQDRRHVLNMFQYFPIAKNWKGAFTFSYATGQAVTLPQYTASPGGCYFLVPIIRILKQMLIT